MRWQGRHAVAALLAISAVAATAATAAYAGAGSKDKRPNIVLIVTDDQARPWANAETMPRVFRRLADPGTSFTDAVVTTPECCPSRATMLTGQYGHNNGVLSNRAGYEALLEKRNTLPVWLRKGGYYTAHVGKYLNRYYAVAARTETAPGWSEWHTLLPRGEKSETYFNFKLAENGRIRRYFDGQYLTDVYNHKAERIVRNRAGAQRPLYLQVDYFAPHSQIGGKGPCADSAIPGRRADLRRYEDEPLPEPPSLNEADVLDKPSFIQARALLSDEELAAITQGYRCQLASLRSVDRGIGRIVAALDEVGELRDTAIIFTSDNAFFRGEHRLPGGKVLPYEEAIRVPLIVRRLGDGSGPARIGRPVGNLDLAPTILDLANAEPCRANDRCRVLDGRSLLPATRGHRGTLPADRAILLEIDYPGTGRPNLSCRYAGVRAADALYVEHSRVAGPDGVCVEVDERELYDLAADPFQLENLYPPGSEPAQELLDELSARLDPLRDCAGIEGRDPPPEGGSNCE